MPRERLTDFFRPADLLGKRPRSVEPGVYGRTNRALLLHVPATRHARCAEDRRVSGCFAPTGIDPRIAHDSRIATREAENGGPMPRILVVEDDPEMRTMYRMGLEATGFAILEATGADDALRIARVAIPNLVVADLLLGSSSGADLCRALRRDPLLRTIPIVVVSGMPGEAARAAVRDAAPDAVLAKPLDFSEFAALCIALCRRPAAAL
jgi:two-component system, cell cycle response regulator DivK